MRRDSIKNHDVINYFIVGDCFASFSDGKLIIPGGTERYILLLAKYLSKLHNHVSVLYPASSGNIRNSGLIDGINLFSFYNPKFLNNWFIDFFSFINCSLKIRQINPDLIHIVAVKYRYSFGVLIAAKLYKKKVIFTRTTLPHLDNRLKLAVFIEKAIIIPVMRKNVDLTIVLTNEMKHIMVKSGFNNVHLISNFIQTPSNVNKVELREKNHLLYVGRVNENKGISILLDAIRILKDSISDIHLSLIGPCESLDTYNNIIISYGLQDNVSFLGVLSHEELVNYYNKCDCFVFPSLFEGGHAMVMLEAMSFGLPIIASDIEPNIELLEHGEYGLLYNLNESDQLAIVISKLLNDEVLKMQYSEKSLVRSTSFSESVVIPEILNLARSIL